ncbi:CHAT domain-containing protein [Chloroflexi bacterium TSY]|nr:CHAT domain-containing protein [Chloroflexi bacterium TSY]
MISLSVFPPSDKSRICTLLIFLTFSFPFAVIRLNSFLSLSLSLTLYTCFISLCLLVFLVTFWQSLPYYNLSDKTLVVLNACLAGRISDQIPFSTVATQMLQAGIPAVIAMQLEISIDTALHFTQFLYEELITGSFPGSIDAAVGFARSNLYALDPNGSGYIAPVLWLNTNDDRIFNFPVQARVETQKYGQENLLTSNVKHSQISLSRSNFTSSKPNRSQFDQYRNTQRSFNRQWIVSESQAKCQPIHPIDPKYRDATKNNTHAGQARVDASLMRQQIEETREWLQKRDLSSLVDVSPQLRYYLQICTQYTKDLHDLFHQLGHIEQDQTGQMHQRYSNKAHEIMELRKKIESLDAVLQRQNTPGD